MIACDPFELFPQQVESCELWKYDVAGKSNELVCSLETILKRNTQTDMPTSDYGSRTAPRRFHVQTSTLPEGLKNDIDLLVGYVLVTSTGRRYKITQASRADDMSQGLHTFITLQANPYGRYSA